MWRIRTAFTGGAGGAQLSTMYFESGLLLAQDAADAVHTFWTAIRNNISNQYSWSVESTVTNVADFTGVPIGVETVSVSGQTGNDSSDPLPWATQGVIRTHTGVYYSGRELQGKIWVPGVTEASCTNGIPNSGYISALNGAIAGLIADSDSELYAFTRAHLNANGVTGGSTWNKFGVLRSRRS